MFTTLRTHLVPATIAMALAVSAGTTASAAQEIGQSRIIQRVVVKVNGEALTQTDLEQLQVDAIRQQFPDQDVRKLPNETLRARIAEVTPRVLVAAVDELLLVQRGRELGFSMTDEQFQRFVENFKTDNKLDDAQLKAALTTEGISMTEWRGILERQVLIQGVQQKEIMARTTLTDNEMKAYYEANRDRFLTPAELTLREVFVAVPTQTQAGQTVVNAAAQEAAEAKIKAARERLVKGEDAAAIVAEVSESGSKANGGIVGPVKLNEVDPSIRTALEPLKVGEVSQPIQTARGYVVFKIESRTEAAPRPFLDVRDEVYQQIMGSRVAGETQKYLDTIRGTAVIEWKDDALRRMYEQARAAKSAPERQ